MTSTHRRLQCSNEGGGREFFELAHVGTGIRIVTPGGLTRTRWSREQVRKPREALGESLSQDGR